MKSKPAVRHIPDEPVQTQSVSPNSFVSPEVQRAVPVKKKRRVRLLPILIILILLATAGIGGYRYYLTHRTQSATARATKQTQVTDPYAGWKTYTSAKEQATFRYPSNWAVAKYSISSNDASNTDHIGLVSPSGAITISYVTDLTGFGNEHSASYPLNTVVDKTPIPSAPGLYVVSGTTTLDGATYYPWIAVQDSNGILTSGVKGNLVTFTSHFAINPSTDDFTGILFSTSGARTSQNSPALTEAQATSWFSGAEAQQAKLILQSLGDAANPAANWYLYVSPGNHYAVRLPDGWNLTQNCTGPYAELLTYYTGYNGQNTDPLAVQPGTRATVAHNCFGKDGAPLIRFVWYNFADPNDDAQKVLDSFSTDSNLQEQASFQTDSGQTVNTYYMHVTQPPQIWSQPEQGTYYEYIIKNHTGFVWVLNFYPPGAVDRHDVVEEAVRTLILNN